MKTLKTPPCLQHYLQNTTSGNRNNNLFTVMKKIRVLNPQSTLPPLHETCKKLNKNLQEPLNNTEVQAICKSIINNQYKQNCYPFNKYCGPCQWGGRKKPYNTYRKHYKKHITRDNYLKTCLPNKIYPWDIMDTTKLTHEEKEIIKEFRMEKDINPMIEQVLSLHKIPYGEKALKEYQRYQSKNKR